MIVCAEKVSGFLSTQHNIYEFRIEQIGPCCNLLCGSLNKACLVSAQFGKRIGAISRWRLSLRTNRYLAANAGVYFVASSPPSTCSLLRVALIGIWSRCSDALAVQHRHEHEIE